MQLVIWVVIVGLYASAMTLFPAVYSTFKSMLADVNERSPAEERISTLWHSTVFFRIIRRYTHGVVQYFGLIVAGLLLVFLYFSMVEEEKERLNHGI